MVIVGLPMHQAAQTRWKANEKTWVLTSRWNSPHETFLLERDPVCGHRMATALPEVLPGATLSEHAYARDLRPAANRLLSRRLSLAALPARSAPARARLAQLVRRTLT